MKINNANEVLEEYKYFFKKSNKASEIIFSKIPIKKRVLLVTPRRFMSDKKIINKLDKERDKFVKERFLKYLDMKYGLASVINVLRKSIKKFNISFPTTDNLYELISNYWIISAVFIADCYNGKELIKKQDIVLDVGANVGLFSILASKKTKNKIYSFEPYSLNYKCLVKNLKNNNVYNVIPIPKAVGEKKGIRKLFFNPEKTAGCSLYKEISDFDMGGYEDVKVISIDEFVKEQKLKRVDIIKADIEGAEMELLKGAEKTIKKFKPKIMISAYHRKDDQIKIKEFILGLREDYKYELKREDGELDFIFY